MEENQPKTGKYALTYGLILGGISVIFALMLFSVDMHYQGGLTVGLVSIALLIAAIVVGTLQFKKANNGFITLSQAMKVGVGVALVGGIIGIVFNLLMANVIDPEMMTKAIEFQKATLEETTSLSNEQIDAQMEMGAKFTTPVMQFTFGLIYSLVMGLILSLITGLIVKKTENVN